jgi:hypothetical protein
MPWAILVAGSLGLVGASLALAGVANLTEAPRTFLVLYGVAFVSYIAALWALARLRGRRVFGTVLVVALLCRLTLLLTPPTLSTDAYRYVWDARVASAGISPYARAPSAPELAALRDDRIYPQLNHPTWQTVYPPGAQLVFRVVYALAPDSVLAMKTAMGLAELATLAVLVSLLGALGLPLARVAIYAWNPLVLVEVWGSGHLDAVAVLSIVAAVRLAIGGRRHAAAAALGLGTLVKLYPAALLVLLLDVSGFAPLATFALVVGAGYAPFAHLGLGALGSLPQYVTTEFFNPGLIRTLIDSPAITTLALGAWVVLASLFTRGVPLVTRVIILVGGVIVASPNVFPWYVLPLVPFLAARPSAAWIGFTGTVAFAYTFFLDQPWAIPVWARVVEVLPLVVGAGWALKQSVGPDRREWLIPRPVRGGQQ